MLIRSKRITCLLLTLLLLALQTMPGLERLAHADASGVQRGTFQYAGMYNNQKDAELDYAYSDAYFEGDARTYNPSLSTMSLCLEMSSWSSLDEENWRDKTANARELLTDIGFTGFAQNDFWQDFPTRDSIGVVAAHKRLEDATLIALAVRGGGYFSEWGSNVLVGAEDEHTGFAQARDNVLTFLNDYIAQQGLTGRVKLWLVGFSRGGAVANMAAGHLNEHGLPGEATLTPEDLYCYTFEAPQGVLTGSAGADAAHSNIHNVINPNDIVPLVAPGVWDFARFNRTSHLLPTITTKHYPQAREQMLQHYEDVLAGTDVLDSAKAAYNVAEYAKTLEVKVNWLSFLPGGEPFIEILTVDNTHLPQSIMLTESVTALVNAVQSRERFHESVEQDVSMLLTELLGAGGGASLSTYIEELGRVFTDNGCANLLYVLEPIVQLNFTSFDQRMAQVADRLREVIPQPEGFTDVVGTAAALVDVVARLITEDPDALLNLVLSLTSTSMIQAHYAEVTIAWLRTEDPNYTDHPFVYDVPESVRIVRVNCPVNVEIFDEAGQLVGSIIDGVGVPLVPGVGCAVNPDGEKVIYLPADGTYEVRIIATGDGQVDVSINEFNLARSDYTSALIYPAVPVQTGDALTAEIPGLEQSEYVDEAMQGSSAIYRLINAGTGEILPISVLRGDALKLFSVRAERSNACGQVQGGGKYVDGSYAQVEAFPVSGSSFLGWYEEDELVSSERVYRFSVTRDVTLEARFGEVTPSHVTFTATEGGRVENVSGDFYPGSTVQLSAVPEEGWLFEEWRITGGELTTLDGLPALIVPQKDTTVTAVFVRAGITCPGCGEVLPEGKHHLAVCGKYGHFTCLPGFNSSEHLYCQLCGQGVLCDGGHGSGVCDGGICPGCGSALPKGGSHLASCGLHYACAAGYEASAHAACAACAQPLCSGEHGACALCGEPLCTGVHGYVPGGCGMYVCPSCGQELKNTESHLAPCGTAGHYICTPGEDASIHSTICICCSGLLCNGDEHTKCSLCGNGYGCQEGHGDGLCNTWFCPGCGERIPIGESHGAICGQQGHFVCTADYDPSIHAVCPYCMKLICKGGAHGDGVCGKICPGCDAPIGVDEYHIAPCERHYTCMAGYVEAEHEICPYCEDGNMCYGNEHGTGYGQCGYEPPAPTTAAPTTAAPTTAAPTTAAPTTAAPTTDAPTTDAPTTDELTTAAPTTAAPTTDEPVNTDDVGVLSLLRENVVASSDDDSLLGLMLLNVPVISGVIVAMLRRKKDQE